MLAGISDYLYPWQFIPFVLALAAWIALGPYLLRWACRKWLPAMSLTIARSTMAVFLAGLAGGAAGLVLFMLPASLGSHLDTDLSIVGIIVAVPGMLAVAYVVIYAMFDQPAGSLVKVLIVPLVGVLLLMAAIAGATIPLTMAQTSARRHRKTCTARLARFHDAIGMYWARRSTLPASLTELVDVEYITPGQSVCPDRGDQETGYFYLPRALSKTSRDQGILACDLRGNHSDGRGVLFANGDCYRYSEADFQKLLELPENKEFAQGLVAVQAK